MYLKWRKQHCDHESSFQGPQRNNANQDDNLKRSWWHAPWFGYIASLLFIGLLMLLYRIDRYLPDVPFFAGAPFGLISVLVALVWGIGPAIFTIIAGLFVIADFLTPGLISSDIPKDIFVIGPFIILQLLAIIAVVRLEVARKGLLAAQRKIQMYAHDLEAANQKLAQMNKDLEQANAQKDYVMMRASHELRTPVTTVLGRTQLLLQRLNKTAPDNTQSMTIIKRSLVTIEQRAMSLRALLDELFDVSSIQSGLLPLRLTYFDLSVLCRSVVEDKNMITGRTIQADMPEQMIIQGDEQRLMQVVTNLVNNAVQYAPAKAEICVSVYPQRDYALLSVHNEGPPLSQEHISMLFEPFYRAPEIEYTSKGWGLGLTISKEIINQHKGFLWVESTEDKGTTFFVKLARHMVVEQAENIDTPLKQNRVLR